MARRVSGARIVRSIEKERRARERELQRQAKIAHQKHLANRQLGVEQLNHDIETQFQNLKTILDNGLKTPITFKVLIAGLENSAAIAKHPGNPPVRPDQKNYPLPKPGFLEQFFGLGKDKRLEQTQALKARFKHDAEKYNADLTAYDAQVQAHKQSVEKYRGNLQSGNADTVIAYCSLILQQSIYPDEFPQTAKLAFNSESGEVVIEYDLPTFDDIMPALKGYKYLKTKDEIQEVAFNKTDERNLRLLYEDVAASITLRTMHEIFRAEGLDVVKSIVFNGMVDGVDKATGKDIRPCLITVQAVKDDFMQLDLSRVDKTACLKHLKAQTSPSYEELLPVKPVVDLVMTDPRFIEEVDILSGVDSRTNLIDTDPFEFEHLISNLFTQIGLKTSTTRASRDGGVDVVAFDDRPIFGGKVIIQAKRYRHTVEVSAVRDLYGSMMNEGASKGILVTTSQYGSESRKFAKDKPIELIDGNGLLYLLQQNGYNVKIEIPK